MNLWLMALGVSLGLGLIAGVAGVIVLIANSETGSSDESEALGRGLPAVAGDLERHADQLTEHGSAMIEVGRASSRDAWVEKGTELLGEARRMQVLADQIRRTKRDLALFPPDGSVNIYRLRANGRALVEAGQELVDHGTALAASAALMVGDGEASGLQQLESGATQLLQSAESLIEDGRRVMSAGRPLIAKADQLERSLGH